MEQLRRVTHVDNVRLSDDGKAVVIVDQTQLPNRLVYLTLRTPKELYDAILELKVRGAPAIGICAGYAAYCVAQTIRATSHEAFFREFAAFCAYLEGARPTAVNLSWALRRMRAVVETHPEADREALLPLLRRECRAIHEEDIAMCRRISEYGLSLLKDGDGVLTHCNAGPLATSRYGTAQGPFYLALERGVHLRIFADETRPLLQGARLTSFELSRAGADVTLICDNMASIVMKNGWVNAALSAATAWRPMATPQTRSVPAVWQFWRSTMACRFMCWGRRPQSIWLAPRVQTSRSSFARKRRSAKSSMPSPWPCPRCAATTRPLT